MYEIKNVKFLYSALKTIEGIDYECYLKISKTGLEMQGIDPSRNSLFHFVLGELGDDFLEIGISLADVGFVLDRVKNAKKITFGYDPKTNRFVIKTTIKNKIELALHQIMKNKKYHCKVQIYNR